MGDCHAAGVRGSWPTTNTAFQKLNTRRAIQIDQLRAFVRCAELGGLSAAARAEKLPKSTLSRLLAELERALGARLLDRSPRGVVLTEEGRIFLDPARKVLADVDLAAASLRPAASGPLGVVRMTAPHTFGVTFIAPLLPAFLAAHPGIDVHIELTSRNVDLIEEGYDLAVRVGPAPPGMIARRLMRNPLLLCGSPEYLSRNGRPAAPDDLARHPLLLIGSPRSRAALSLRRGAEEVLVTAPARLLSSDPAVIVRSAVAGAGIGQIPRILAPALLAEGSLVPVLSDWTMPVADISLLFANQGALAPRVRAFVDHLRKALARSELA